MINRRTASQWNEGRIWGESQKSSKREKRTAGEDPKLKGGGLRGRNNGDVSQIKKTGDVRNRQASNKKGYRFSLFLWVRREP